MTGKSLWLVGLGCHRAVYGSVVDGEFWLSVLQLEWAVLECCAGSEQGPAPLCIAPALSCSPYTASAAQHPSHTEPWAPATQFMDNQGDHSSLLICFVVQNWGIRPKIFLACVFFALQSHWFPSSQSNSKEPNTPKDISPFTFSMQCKFKSSGSLPLQGCTAAVPCTPAPLGPQRPWPGHQETMQTLGVGSIWKGRSTDFPKEACLTVLPQIYSRPFEMCPLPCFIWMPHQGYCNVSQIWQKN